MGNLHEWAKLTPGVSVKDERLSGFVTESLSERKGGLPGASKATPPPLNPRLVDTAVN